MCDREKFRIRCYDSNYDFIRLEKKVKKGNLGYKLSTSLSQEETAKIITGEIDWMPAKKDVLLTQLHQKMYLDGLKPKVIVDYTREPFIYPAGNVRITLDYDIRTSLHQINLLDSDLPMIPASPGSVLLEVKYDNYLPDIIRDIIQLQYRAESAFSKYAVCRQYD